MCVEELSLCRVSGRTYVSIINTRVFRIALAALAGACTLWRIIKHLRTLRGPVALDKYILYFVPRMWWHIRNISMKIVLHTSQLMEICCGQAHNALWCVCLSPASATLYRFTIAMIWMPQSPHICLDFRCCHLIPYSQCFRYISWAWICFAIVLFYQSQIYCSIFALSSTVPSVFHIVCWSIICFECSLHHIHFRLGTILALIQIWIPCFHVKPLKVSHGLSLPAGGGEGMVCVAVITVIFILTTGPLHPNMQYVICEIVVNRGVGVTSSNIRLLTSHFGGQLSKMHLIVNMSCIHGADHGSHWVVFLLDMILDYSKCVIIHPLLIALRYCVPSIHQEYTPVCNARRGSQHATHCSTPGYIVITIILVVEIVWVIRSVSIQLVLGSILRNIGYLLPLQQSRVQCGAGKYDMWQRYMAVHEVNHGNNISISILTRVIHLMIKWDVDNSWNCLGQEELCTWAIC